MQPPSSIRRVWTPEETAVALYLYLTLSFAGISEKDPLVLAAAAYLGRTPASVKLKAFNLAACDAAIPQKGMANGSRTDREVWRRFMGDGGNVPSLDLLLEAVEGFLTFERTREHEATLPGLLPDTAQTETEKLVLVRRREGQALFRASTLTNYAGRCAFSGISLSPLVEAAHILPWSDCPQARLRPDNGIALNILLHRAWDAGLIGINPDGRLLAAADAYDRLRSAVRKEDERGLLATPVATAAQADLALLESVHGLTLSAPKHVAPNRDFLAQRFHGFCAASL